MSPKIKKNPKKGVTTEQVTAFQLAQTAIALCLLERKSDSSSGQQPELYFGRAIQLLTAAEDHLKASGEEIGQIVSIGLFGYQSIDDFRAHNKPIPFDFLLRSQTDSVDIKTKKPRTLLGITTLKGLEKAIRKYLTEKSAELIKSKHLSYNDYKQLITKRKEAYQRRGPATSSP